MVRAVFPGTFDPIHFGHVDIATRAAKIFDEVIIAVYDRPLKNLLFPPNERFRLVKSTFENYSNIIVKGYSGLTVDFCRLEHAQVIVRGLRVFSDFELEFRSTLANRRLAPEIEVVSLMTEVEHTFLSSTTVKEIAALGGDVSSMVPPNILEALKVKFAQYKRDGNEVAISSLRD